MAPPTSRDFRFSIGIHTAKSSAALRDKAKRLEGLGFDVLHLPDHLGAPAPFPVLTAIAAATSTVRLGTYVLNACFYKPALLARDAAAVNDLSDGRLELGLGAGYVREEFEAAELPYPSAGQRVDYLEHVTTYMKRHHAKVPILIAGNGNRLLTVAAQHADTKYALGSVLNHVLLHQTVIGQEAMAQLEMAGDYPDIIVGCTGGGSNFAGIAFPFIGAGLRGGPKPRVIACEPSACPSLTRGKYAYDFGDTGHLTPLVKMHTLGSTFVPPGFHAGGLRYHGMAPMVSHIHALGLIEARAYHQKTCFDAGVQFARCEGIVPAPEATHAVRCAVDEALRCKKEGKAEVILFNMSGHGHFDMSAYINYFEGKLVDQEYDEGELAMALAGLPSVAA